MPINSSARRWWLAGLCCAVYAILWIGWVRDWSWVVASDSATLESAHRIGVEHHGWVTFWNAWCAVFSPLSFRVVTAGFVVYAFMKRQVRLATFLLVSVELSGLVTEAFKRLADRPRPETALAQAASSSFPSGHALGSMVAVLALGGVLLPCVRRSIRPWLVATGTLIVLSVGLGRVALNVHHLSDVVAGWAMGYVYFVLCLLILRGGRIGATEADETPAMPGSAR